MIVYYSNHIKQVNTLKYALLCYITQRVVVIPYRRLGTTYRSHLQGLRNPRLVYFAAEA
jgi:hypothetical protein